MTALNQTIITSYEVCELSPEEIAEQEGLEVEAVKALLMQFSSDYRNKIKDSAIGVEEVGEDGETVVKKEPEGPISKEEYKNLWDMYKQLGMFTENDHLKERALRYMIDEFNGRNDPPPTKQAIIAGVAGDIKGNVLTFNRAVKASKQLTNGRKKRVGKLPEVVLEAEEIPPGE